MVREQPVLAARPVDADALYRAHVRPLYAFIYSKVGNRETAEDITADVFTKALMYLDPTREAHSIVAWLYRVARNAVADYWRAGRGAHVIVFDEALLGRPAPPHRATLAHQEQVAARAQALLDRLPDSYRTVLSLRVLEGCSVAEAAARMGTSTGNVKVLQHRALKRAATLRMDQAQIGAWNTRCQSPAVRRVARKVVVR